MITIKTKLFEILKDLYYKFVQYWYLLPNKKKKRKCENEIINIPRVSKEIKAFVTPVYLNKKAILTIISDDGFYYTGKILKKYTEQFNIPITVAGSVRLIHRHRKFWKSVVKEHEFECVSHSYNHIRMEEGTAISKDYKKLYHEIVHSCKYFKRLFGKEQIAFVCPENQMCSLGYEILKSNNIYAVARGNRGLNGLSPDYGNEPGQWLYLKRCGIKDHTNKDIRVVRNNLVDTAIQEGAWLIEMWHDVDKNEKLRFQTITPEAAEEHLSYVSGRKDKIWTALFTDAIKYIYEREHAIVKAAICDNYLFVYVNLESLPMDIFDHELTVKVNCSSNLFDNYKLDYQFDDEMRFILVNVFPGKLMRIPLK